MPKKPAVWCAVILLDSPAAYSEGEAQAVRWLAQRRGWETCDVERRSEKEFDITCDVRLETGLRSLYWLPKACLYEWRAGWPGLDHLSVAVEQSIEVQYQEFLRMLAMFRAYPMFSFAFVSAARAVWNEISMDLTSKEYASTSAADAIEMTFDADRLSMAGDDGAAQAELDFFDGLFGYERVAREFARKYSLR